MVSASGAWDGVGGVFVYGSKVGFGSWVCASVALLVASPSRSLVA